jgi:hypothetical protein
MQPRIKKTNADAINSLAIRWGMGRSPFNGDKLVKSFSSFGARS